MENVILFRIIGPESEYSYYPLYPHAFDDFVFLIYQRGKLTDDLPRSSSKPLLQWLIFMLIAAMILFSLRKFVERRERRLTCRTNIAAAPDFFFGSFVDSMGVFLGVGLKRIGICRAERWFLISFSVFGLFFTTIYTNNLFVMLTAVNQSRITSIDQLFRTNIPITVDHWVSSDDDFAIRIKS